MIYVFGSAGDESYAFWPFYNTCENLAKLLILIFDPFAFWWFLMSFDYWLFRFSDFQIFGFSIFWILSSNLRIFILHVRACGVGRDSQAYLIQYWQPSFTHSIHHSPFAITVCLVPDCAWLCLMSAFATRTCDPCTSEHVVVLLLRCLVYDALTSTENYTILLFP